MLLSDFLDFHARERRQSPCVVQDDRTLSYAQVLERANKLANAFIAAGVDVGDRFALLSKNSIDMVVIYLAASRVGAVPVPLNWRLAPPEWAYIIDNADAKVIIAEAEFCSGVEAAGDQIPNVQHRIAIGLQSPKEKWVDFGSWWGECSAATPQNRVCEDDALYQMYTSGTTGRPKGAVLTHRSVITNSLQCMPYFSGSLVPDRRMLIVMPMFHAGATSSVIGCLISGTTMIIHNDFSPDRLAQALSEHQINVVNLVPAMIQAMLVHVPDLAERNYSNLEVIVYGASAIAADTLRRAMDIFQCDFFQGYGQTEASACLTMLTAQDHRRALESRPDLLLSAGRSVMGTTLRIVDGAGCELPRGEVGELVARGPQTMKGYWRLPEATAATLAAGWLHTGDAAFMDKEGYIYIQDRVKDMVVSGGENIYPREIENVLFDHPHITDAAVIGVPDTQYGEALMAFLVLSGEATLQADDIIAFCRTKLGGYKVPRQFKFVEELPRNSSGKVLKTVLREPYWSAGDRAIS